MTYDGSDNFASGVTALVNGVKIARYDYSSSSGTQNAANQPWQVGALANGSSALNGAIAWLGWWNRVLPPDQIMRLHAEPFGMCEGLQPLAADGLARPRIDGALASDTPLVGAVA
jgi:hypothetical protein